jgi:hypothetical protein
MNTSEMISNLKIQGSFPTSDDLFSNSDFLVLFNNQLKTDITPMMLKLNEEFFLQYKDFTIASGSRYRIPRRAIGAKIRDLQYIDASNNYSSIDRLFEEDRPQSKSGYYMLRNEVELSTDFITGTLRMKYFARPNELVLPSSCGQVVTIDTNNNQVILSSAPATFTTGVNCDFIQNNNPYDLLAYDQEITGVSGTTITFASLPDGLEVGDWLCLANQSPVAMIPDELHPVLVKSCLCATLSSKKDKSYEQEMIALQQMKDDAINMLDPRVENDSVKFRSGALLNFFGSRVLGRGY